MDGVLQSREYAISIHAPARGATDYNKGVASGEIISIHAPARGATRFYAGTNARYGISIHAPARGATDPEAFGAERIALFQSTLPQGERRRPTQHGALENVYFNPRSHKGSDHAESILKSKELYFNPRSHKGSDR